MCVGRFSDCFAFFEGLVVMYLGLVTTFFKYLNIDVLGDIEELILKSPLMKRRKRKRKKNLRYLESASIVVSRIYVDFG